MKPTFAPLVSVLIAVEYADFADFVNSEARHTCPKNNGQTFISTYIVKTSMVALRKTGPLFDLAGLSTWFFVEAVQETDPADQSPSVKPQPTDGPQKPLGGGDAGSQAAYSCPVDEKKTYTT
ncbi:hypothetical protein CDD83_5154 [Cordyceps sp. RAO-2017]|nr:hypothetical protein CDD83_5154 [Cordyceps sp. RAO-2017]